MIKRDQTPSDTNMPGILLIGTHAARGTLKPCEAGIALDIRQVRRQTVSN